MAQPPPYDRSYNFHDYQAENPLKPLPADKLDEEFARVKTTLDAVLQNLKLIQRDDTALANKSVGFDQLKDELNGFGFNPPTEWEPGKNYIVRDTVFYDTRFYRCLESHVSSADFEDDLNAGLWDMVADFTVVQTTAIAARDAALQAQADAEQAQADAEQAQSDAEAARDDAIAAKNQAVAAKDDAEDARDAAAGSASAALAAASAASASASTAGTHASNASSSASAASSSASSANDAKVAAENARDAAVVAQGLAEAAQAGAEQAQSDAEAAQQAAEDARDAALLAQSGAESARDAAIGAKDDALLAKSGAESARDAAVVAQGLAEAAQAGAEQAQADAEAARDDAISARNAAQAAQTDAENAADRAEQAASGIEHPVSYAPQTPDPSEQAQARANLGLGSAATEDSSAFATAAQGAAADTALQPTITTTVTFNLPLSASNKLMDLQQGYGIYSDNTGAGSHNTRLWFEGPNGGEVLIGPRAGASFLHQIRLRANTTRIEGDCVVTGALTLSGDPTSNLHAATKQYVDNAVSSVPTSPVGLYTGSSVNQTSFPVGHHVLVTGANVDRNGSTTVRLSSDASVAYGASGSGSILSGTWRSRGTILAGVAFYALMQRTA